MDGERHENGEPDWPDDPGSGLKTLDELSREEILRALAGLDERVRADGNDIYSLMARGMLHGRVGDDRRAMEDFSRVIGLEPDNAEALENRAEAGDDLGDSQLRCGAGTGCRRRCAAGVDPVPERTGLL